MLSRELLLILQIQKCQALAVDCAPSYALYRHFYKKDAFASLVVQSGTKGAQRLPRAEISRLRFCR